MSRPLLNNAAKPATQERREQDSDYEYNCTEKAFTWVVEFKVSEGWVADGFDMTAGRAHDMLAATLPYAYDHELGVRIVKAPTPASILNVQGYDPD